MFDSVPSQDILDCINLLKENGHISTGGYIRLMDCYAAVCKLEEDNRELKELVTWLDWCRHDRHAACGGCKAFVMPKEKFDKSCMAVKRMESMGIEPW